MSKAIAALSVAGLALFAGVAHGASVVAATPPSATRTASATERAPTVSAVRLGSRTSALRVSRSSTGRNGRASVPTRVPSGPTRNGLVRATPRSSA